MIGNFVFALHNTRQMQNNAKHLLIFGCHNRLSIVVIAATLQACASVLGKYGPDEQSRAEFEQRVEAAFRLQNRMTSAVMEIQSDGSDRKQHEPIIQAEQIMEKDCSHLNDYVSREIDGKSKGILLLRRVENSVEACEDSAEKVEELLNEHQR